MTLPARSSSVEPGVTPANAIVLEWKTLAAAAEEAGISGRYGGIHFRRADLAGHQLGQSIAAKVWAQAQSYFDGTVKPTVRITASATHH